MSWAATSSIRFERPLDTIEKFFVALAASGAPLQREHWSVSVSARFRWHSSESLPSALRQAWKTIRHDLPQIACTIEGDKMVYHVPDGPALDAWLAQTCIIEPFTMRTTDLVASFKPSPLPTLHYLPGTSEVLIHCSHWRIDGIGALRLLNRLFTLLTQPQPVPVVFGTEAPNLSPSLEEAALISVHRTSSSAEYAQSLFNSYVHNLPSIGLPTTPPPGHLPGATRFLTHRFTPSSTSSLLAACKSHSLSPTSAVHAALVQTTYRLSSCPTKNPDGPVPPYTAMCAFDLRPYLASSHSADPVALYMSGLPISLPSPTTGATFAFYAHALQALYSQSLAPDRSLFLSSLKDWVTHTTGLLAAAPMEGMTEPSEPALISLGLVDRYVEALYKDRGKKEEDDEDEKMEVAMVEVEDFWLGVEMLTRQLEFYVWTFRGRLVFSVCFNQAFYESEFVERVMDGVGEVLEKELSVYLQLD